jgi:hypothetical protein
VTLLPNQVQQHDFALFTSEVIKLEAFSVTTSREGMAQAIAYQQAGYSDRASDRKHAPQDEVEAITLKPWSPDAPYLKQLRKAAWACLEKVDSGLSSFGLICV